MIAAGIIWNSPIQKNEELSQELKHKLVSLTGSQIYQIDKKYLSVFVSQLPGMNDFDEVLENEEAVLIGRAFHKESYKPLNQKDLKSLLHKSTEIPLKTIWGKYIFITYKSQIPHVEVLRDPTGQLHFYYCTSSQGDIIFSSEISILYEMCLPRPSYNWKYLSSFILHSATNSATTPFNDIYELPPGGLLSIDKSTVKLQTVWDPYNFYNPSYKSFNTETSILETLFNSIRAWVKPYRHIFLDLSGGLDSSSLLFCLKNVLGSNQQLTAINFHYSDIQTSQEQEYARKACQETNVELIEFNCAETQPMSLTKPLAFKPNKPATILTHLLQEQTIYDTLKVNDSFIFVSGHGGDHVFMASPSIRSIADAFLEEGLLFCLKKMRDLSLYYRKPYYPLLKGAFRGLYQYLSSTYPKPNILEKKQIAYWVTEDLIQEASRNPLYPIFNKRVNKIPPGKYDHINAIYRALASIYLDVRDSNNPFYYPLLSQPLLELAIAIPTYILFANGYDRYPLRNIISQNFNTNVVWRRNKGATTGAFQLAIRKNLDYVQQLCLEGRFAQQKLVNRDLLHQNIFRIANGQNEFIWPLMQLMSVELYLEYWH